MARCDGSKSIPPPPTNTAGDTQRVATWAGGRASGAVHASEQGQPGQPPLSLRSNGLREQKLGGWQEVCREGWCSSLENLEVLPSGTEGSQSSRALQVTSEPAQCENPQTPGSGTKNSALLTARGAAGSRGGGPIRSGSGEAPPKPACRGRGPGPGNLTLLHHYDLDPRKTLRCSGG